MEDNHLIEKLELALQTLDESIAKQVMLGEYLEELLDKARIEEK